MSGDRKVEVCSECLCASCWHGEFLCEKSRDAGTVYKTVRELRALKREHPSYYSKKHLKEIYGHD